MVALADRLVGPSLVLIESPMGEGKTEAALYLADRHLATGGRGAYVALPTQATSNQMFGRVRDFLAGRFPDEVLNLQLLHGHAALSAEFEVLRRLGDRLFAPSNVHDSDPTLAGVAAAEWFTYRKRGLLAPFGVGTIDQALLAALQTRHGFVRLFGLTDKTVVLDEVHAYDAYMSTLIERLLEWLAALGSSVVLLSATLPAARRADLLAAFARGLGRPEAALPPPVPYPRISWLDRSASGAEEVAASARSIKTVGIAWRDDGDDALADRLRVALDDGGCAAVVCNTVARAQAVYRALAPRFPNIATDGDPELDLLHARLLFEDRETRERRALRRFGKPDPATPTARPHRAILVATQVIEQSLDLDFDLLVSDPAPADLVLQRLGRLHRHPRPRPAGLANATLWLRAPVVADGVPTFDSGTGYVYDAHVLLRSWLALRDRHQLDVPADVEALIEAVYDDTLLCPTDAPASLRARWDETRRRMADARSRDESKATHVRVLPPFHEDDIFEDYNQQLDEDAPGLHSSLQALTRLGDRRVSVVLLAADDQAALRRSETPTIEIAKRLLRRSVTLGDRRIVGDLDVLPVPSGWKRSPLLRHHRPLAPDDTGAYRVGRHVLRNDPDLGIVVDHDASENARAHL